jgi:hypothetical protein
LHQKIDYTKKQGKLGYAVVRKLSKKILVFTDNEIEINVVANTNHSNKYLTHGRCSNQMNYADTLQNSVQNHKIITKHFKRLKLFLKD